ncbi:phospholipase-like protein [Tanacetum coccineum]|uniref:Phospholipase-like protein n=1 Tax=Tanacetum coccineum TaxID=301880 RepID=A0ABQ5BUV3_9ASTR
MAEIFAKILALRKEVVLVKGDGERITKLERLVNQIVVNQGKGGSSNDLMSTCSRPNIDNVKVTGDGMPIENADGNHVIRIGLHNLVNQGLGGSSNDPMSSCSPADTDNGEVAGAGMGFDNFDGKNDIRNDNQNVVNQGFGGFANDPMELQSSCSRTDMDNGKLACSGMGIDKVDGMNDIPNLNHNCVNQGKGGSANDPMSTCSLTDIDNGEVTCDGMVIDKADGKNEYTYSQRTPSTLDVLIKAMDCANDNPRIDVLQHDNDVDRFIVELNHHLTVDIHVEPVHVYDFADDYMSVLNDEEHEEEHEAKYSLDEMKLIDEEAKLIVKDPLVKQHVDAFIDEQEDKTTVLQENAKHESNKLQYFNVVKDDYKPCLASVFSNVKPKRKKCGVERNYMLWSVKERKKRLAMSLDSPYGQQATTTPAPPKTRSQSERGFHSLKIRSINELMTLEVFAEQLSRPHNFKKEKVTLPDGFTKFLKMQDPLEYRFLWGYQDIAVTRAFWLVLACLDPAKDGWLHDNVYFPVNEPKKHWCLAELHISSGVVTFYDTLESKGISVESYEIKYMFPKVVEQADLYGDCGVWLSLDGGSITSGPAIMTMPSHYFLKLLGFNNHDLPIVEASTGHIIGHTVQVYMENSQSFKNVTIQGNVSSFFVGAYKESLILAAYPNHSLHYAG